MRNATLILVLALCLVLPLGSALAGAKQDIQAGNQAAMAGKLEQAVKLYSQALKDPNLTPANQAVAHNNRGSAYDDLEKADAALADYNRALQLDPKYAEAYYNRSFALQKKNLLMLALKDARDAARLKPSDPDYKTRLEYLKGLVDLKK